MNTLDNIKNFNPDNYESDDEYDTDSEISSSDLEYDILTSYEINSKNCQTIVNQNNRLKNKIRKYLHKNLKENMYLKEKINILLDRNYKLINLNNFIINNYKPNTMMYKIIGSFFTSTILGVCYYYWKNVK